jgi:hypothetical protein
MFSIARILCVYALVLWTTFYSISSAQDQPPNQNTVDFSVDFPKDWKLAAQNAGVQPAPEDWKPILQNFQDTVRFGRETSKDTS